MSVEITKQPLTRQTFVRDWSEVAMAWGLSKNMAAIHAYLLTATAAVSAEELQENLEVSRGCISTNLATLLEYGFVEKVISENRREYYEANKNTFQMLQSAIAYRREKELLPFIQLLEKYCPSRMKDELSGESLDMICDIRHYAVKTDKFLSGVEKKSESVFVRSFLKMIK